MTNETPMTGWDALRRPRFLLTGWPWRAAAHLVSTAVVVAVVSPVAMLITLPWLLVVIGVVERSQTALLLVGFGLLAGTGMLLVFGPLLAAPLAMLERLRLRLIDDRPVPAIRRVRPGGSVAAMVWRWYTDPVTWREVGYAAWLVVVGPLLALLVGGLLMVAGVLAVSPALILADGGQISLGLGTVDTPLAAVPYSLAGVVMIPLLAYLTTVLVAGFGTVSRALLHTPAEQVWAELTEVSQSRARLADTYAAERRQLERDLHDGAQQRLVSLTLQLGMARHDLPADSPAATAIEGAHEQAKELLTEFRDLVLGIYPKVLGDLGLPAALRTVADRATVPVRVDADLPQRLPRQLEETGYFVVSEALTNVAKHSGATGAEVRVARTPGLLTLEVRGDGRGGADPAGGSGLVGLADRAAVVGGRILLSSPPGGPTVIRAELPCPE